MPDHLPVLSGVIGLTLTSAVLIAVPGPSIMFFIGQVIAAGRTDALRSVIGNALGMALTALLVAVGLGTLITHSALVLTFVRMLGAGVLLLIGLNYILARRGAGKNDEQISTRQRGPLLSGAIVGFTNPKGLIMFGTIVPSFLPANSGNPVAALLFYSLIPITLGLLIDFIWVAAAHAVHSRAFFSTHGMRRVQMAGGGLIVAMAVMLAWEAVGPMFS